MTVSKNTPASAADNSMHPTLHSAGLTCGGPLVESYSTLVMTKKSDRKKRKRTKARLRGVPITSLDPKEIPMAIRAMNTALERFMHYAQGYLGGNESKEQAVKRVTDDMTSAMDEIECVSRVYPIFDLMERVRFDETAIDPNNYRESETEGRGSVVEIVAYILATSARESGTEAEVKHAEQEFGQSVQHILCQGRVLMDLISTLDVNRVVGYWTVRTRTMDSKERSRTSPERPESCLSSYGSRKPHCSLRSAGSRSLVQTGTRLHRATNMCGVSRDGTPH